MIYAREVRLEHADFSGWYYVLLGSAGLSLGGSAIFAMHFVGMHSMQLRLGGRGGEAGEPVPHDFASAPMVASALVAVLSSATAIHVALPAGEAGGAGGADAAQLLPGGTPSGTPAKLGWRATLLRTAVDGRRHFLAGAAIFAAGIAVMHYLGMLSMRGPFSLDFSPGFVVASVAVAALASGAGLLVIAHVSQRDDIDSLGPRVGAAFVFALGTVGAHYTGMVGVEYCYEPGPAAMRAHTATWGSASVHPPPWQLALCSLLLNVIQLVLCGHGSVHLHAKQLELDATRAERLRAHAHCVALLEHSGRLLFPLVLCPFSHFCKVREIAISARWPSLSGARAQLRHTRRAPSAAARGARAG